MAEAHLVDNASPDSDFYPFDCIQEEQAQFAVKPIKVQDVPECGARLERLVGFAPWSCGFILKRKRIGSEPVVTNETQVMLCLRLVRDFETAMRKSSACSSWRSCVL